jgi:hypothetical protein
MDIFTVANRMKQQKDVLSAKVVVRADGKKVVRAKMQNRLHDGTKVTRVRFYDAHGDML